MNTLLLSPKEVYLSWKDILSQNDLLAGSVEVLKSILSSGYKAYIVGGAPRDLLLGRKLSDIDIATNCPIQVLENKFNTYEIGKSKSFGLVGIVVDGKPYEVAQFRQDGKYENGRRPSSIEMVGSFKEDVFRRDFTINSMALAMDGNLIDYVGGISDLRSGVIKAVGNPYERFYEDRLRMVRAARFAAALDFRMDPQTRRSIRRLFKLVNTVSKNRLRLEIIKAASGKGVEFARFLKRLDDLKLLFQILPEVANLKNFIHNFKHHPEGPTVYDHVIKCLEISNADYISKLSIMFHDVGKGVTFSEENGKPHFYGHAKAGVKLAKYRCKRLGFSKAHSDAIEYAVANHMKWNKIPEMKPSKIARMVSNPNFDILVEVTRVDEFSRGETFKHKGKFAEELKRAIEIKKEWENRIINVSMSLVSGNRIMEITGLGSGPYIGAIKKKVEEIIIDNNIDVKDQDPIDKLIMSVCEKIIEGGL